MGNAGKLRVRLYVAGGSPNSQLARMNLERLLERVRDHATSVEVFDVLDDPERAVEDRVLVTPMLIRLEPAPVVEIVGNLSNLAAVAAALGIADS